MELYYQQYGEDGPPLIILHGLLGASGNWHTLSRTVFSERFRIFAVDQRNHGRSPHSGPFDYATLAADVRDFMDVHALEQAHLLGHSMGGKTAMRTALTYPNRVDKLVVADMAPKAYPPHHEDIFAALRSLELSRYGSRKEIDAALADRIPSRPVRQFLMKNLSHDGDGGYTWQMNLNAIYSSYDDLNAAVEADRTFDGPTLFLRGEHSDYVSDADVTEIRARFPNAKLQTIEGAGHWLHADRPQAFAEAVVQFLNI